MPKESTLEKYKDHLFDDVATIDATPAVQKQILIYRYLFTIKLGSPYVTNAQLAKSLSAFHGITSVGQAYRYITEVDIMVGDVRSSEKAWIRYLVVETLKEGIQMAKAKGDLKSMVAAAGKLAKYTRLDQEDQDPMPWETVKPQPIEYANDPTLLGLAPVENPRALVDKVKKKYMDAEEVEYEETK